MVRGGRAPLFAAPPPVFVAELALVFGVSCVQLPWRLPTGSTTWMLGLTRTSPGAMHGRYFVA